MHVHLPSLGKVFEAEKKLNKELIEAYLPWWVRNWMCPSKRVPCSLINVDAFWLRKWKQKFKEERFLFCCFVIAQELLNFHESIILQRLISSFFRREYSFRSYSFGSYVNIFISNKIIRLQNCCQKSLMY